MLRKKREDYYPFGLTFNSFQRSGNQVNRFKYNGIEFQSDLGWNSYLAEFRSYDPSLGRWHQIDPKTSERESPFVGFGNNPILYSDPLGDTVVYFIDYEGAGGQGHMAMAFQNGDGAWFYASQGATGSPNQSKLLSGSNADGGLEIHPLAVSEERAVLDESGEPVLDESGDPVMETVTRNATLEEVTGFVQSGALGYGYDDNIVLNTTKDQDTQISKNAFRLQRGYKRGEEKYNVYFNNCTDACQDITQKNTDINLPIDFDPRPNSYFDKLKDYGKKFNAPKK